MKRVEPTNPCRIRLAHPGEFDALALIYRESIRVAGPAHYTPVQVATWASHADDRDAFRSWLLGATVWVGVNEHDECIGFAGLEPQGRISALFVAPQYMRQGVASRLLQHLAVEARSRGLAELETAASEFSRPLFAQFGFALTEVEQSQFKGVDFTRYAMRARI